jgi:ABC-type lipoprotein release transport system permease subunit
MLLGSVAFLTNGLEQEAELSATFAPDITVQYLQAGRQIPIPAESTEVIAKMPGVKAIPRVWGYIYFHNRLYTVMGIDPKSMPIPKEINLAMSSGRFLQPDDRKVTVVGSFLAESFGLKVGDITVLYDQSMKPINFTVIGIFTTDVRLYTADLIIVHIKDARAFFEIGEDMSTDLCVYVEDPAETRLVAEQILKNVPNTRVLTREVLRQALLTAYGARSGFVSVMWLILLLSVVLVAWNQASAVSTEARREVGILKALGFSTADILEIRLIEAIILGLLSASVGTFLGIVYVLYLGAPILKEFMLGWAAIYPEFPLPIRIRFSTVATLYAIAIFPLLVGTVIPAWTSAITEPDEAMRGT